MVATFASKGRDLFAAVHGTIRVDTDRAVIDRLWNRFVAAWFEGGKEDPKRTLLRLDPDSAQIWGDASSFVAGVKILLGLLSSQRRPSRSHATRRGVALRGATTYS